MTIVPIFADAKALSEPAKLLIEKFSDMFGVLYEPTRVRRLAAANADATRIEAEAKVDALTTQAKGEIAVSDLHRRAFIRWAKAEARNQENLEAIESHAVDILESEKRGELAEGVPPKNPPSDDWIAQFVDAAKATSDEQMRLLWAKLLAGEFATPGRFSKRTVNIIATLEPQDAADFAHLCRFTWEVDSLCPLIYGLDGSIYLENGITFDFLQNLDALGLIHFTWNRMNHVRFESAWQNIGISYFGERFKFRGPVRQISTGQVRFTKVGQELLTICGSEPIPGYIEYILQWHLPQGLERGYCSLASEITPRTFHVDT